MQRRSRVDLPATALFALLLAAPAVDGALRPSAGTAAELRAPAPLPPPPRSLAELARFPERLQQHHSDTFGLRDVLLRARSVLFCLWLRVTPSEDLVVARDGWIGYAAGDVLQDHRGARPFLPADLERWRTGLERRRDLLAASGARHLFVLCPNKETIYPERLPPAYAPVGPTRMDQLAAHLAEHSTAEFLDLRPVLHAARARDAPDDLVYTPYGTHWTGRGAHAAYHAIASRLASWFPAVEPIEASECVVELQADPEDSWGRRLYVEDLLVQSERQFRPPHGRAHVVASAERQLSPTWMVVHDERLPRGVLFHDSFFTTLRPLLPEHFSDLRLAWSDAFDEDLVAAARPDVVIDLYTERMLLHADAPRTEPRRAQSAPTIAEEFDAARTVLFRLDGSATGGLVVEGAARAARAPDGGVEIAAPGTGDRVVFTAHERRDPGPAWLRTRLATPRADILDVYWRASGAAGFSRRDRSSWPVRAGSDEITLRLDPAPGPVEVLIRTRSGGAAVLHALELRAR